VQRADDGCAGGAYHTTDLPYRVHTRAMRGEQETTIRPSGSVPAAGRRSDSSDDWVLAQRLAALPPYARSLLRIRVTVLVTLATTRLPVRRVMEIAPGTILHLNKPCDEPLTLCVGGCEIAVGETVKVGEKFGLRISSMLMPREKFEPVKPPSRS
jgi:flagellar motor switch protein FliN/FliY